MNPLKLIVSKTKNVESAILKCPKAWLALQAKARIFVVDWLRNRNTAGFWGKLEGTEGGANYNQPFAIETMASY